MLFSDIIIIPYSFSFIFSEQLSFARLLSEIGSFIRYILATSISALFATVDKVTNETTD